MDGRVRAACARRRRQTVAARRAPDLQPNSARLGLNHVVQHGSVCLLAVDGKPSLMTFREVETLFHEFGHCSQHMLTTVDDSAVSGDLSHSACSAFLTSWS